MWVSNRLEPLSGGESVQHQRPWWVEGGRGEGSVWVSNRLEPLSGGESVQHQRPWWVEGGRGEGSGVG